MFARYSRTHNVVCVGCFYDEFYEQPEIGIQAIADQTFDEDQGF